METEAFIRSFFAIASILYNSETDSTLKDNISFKMPCLISSEDLPTPEKIILLGSAPIDRALCISPPETTSKPQPTSFNSFNTERLLNDLTEKQAMLSGFVNEFTYIRAFSVRAFFE